MASQGAKIDDIEALKTFRVALIKFAEIGNAAISGAESEIDRTLGTLERDQASYWNNQLRKRHEEVMKCEEAVRAKRLFKGADGRVQSAVDEQKALNIAKRRKEEAEQKIVAVKKAVGILRKEAALYKGRTQKLATTLQGDIPRAVHQIDAMLDQLAQYLSIQTTGAGLGLAEAAESIAQLAATTKVGYERLRDRTPTAEERSAATVRVIPPEDPFFQPWPAGLVEAWQADALQMLKITPQAIDPDHKIIVARDCWLQAKLYLERREPAFEGDSGWYLGSAADPVAGEKTQYDSIRAGDLMSTRPDWGDLLQLPYGFLVVIDSGGPMAMLDGAGLDVWSVALMMSPPKEEEPAAQTNTEAAPAETSAAPAAQ
jgi:hypothetical protein